MLADANKRAKESMHIKPLTEHHILDPILSKIFSCVRVRMCFPTRPFHLDLSAPAETDRLGNFSSSLPCWCQDTFQISVSCGIKEAGF